MGYIVEATIKSFDHPDEIQAFYSSKDSMQINEAMQFLLGKRLHDAAGDSSLSAYDFQLLRVQITACSSMLETMNRLGNEYLDAESHRRAKLPREVEAPLSD